MAGGDDDVVVKFVTEDESAGSSVTQQMREASASGLPVAPNLARDAQVLSSDELRQHRQGKRDRLYEGTSQGRGKPPTAEELAEQIDQQGRAKVRRRLGRPIIGGATGEAASAFGRHFGVDVGSMGIGALGGILVSTIGKMFNAGVDRWIKEIQREGALQRATINTTFATEGEFVQGVARIAQVETPRQIEREKLKVGGTLGAAGAGATGFLLDAMAKGFSEEMVQAIKTFQAMDDGLKNFTDRMADFSPDVAIAKAEAEIGVLERQLEEADRLGEKAAEFVERRANIEANEQRRRTREREAVMEGVLAQRPDDLAGLAGALGGRQAQEGIEIGEQGRQRAVVRGVIADELEQFRGADLNALGPLLAEALQEAQAALGGDPLENELRDFIREEFHDIADAKLKEVL